MKKDYSNILSQNNGNSKCIKFKKNVVIYLRIVVYCSHSKRSSDQSLQFPNPTHHNFNFISDSGRLDRVFCLFFMARIEPPPQEIRNGYMFPHQATTNALFVLFCPPTAPRLPCGCQRRCKGFPSALSWPCPFGDRSALSVSRTSLPIAVVPKQSLVNLQEH